jgi:hypothetical protein
MLKRVQRMCTPSIARRDARDCRVRWDLICDTCTLGAAYPQLGDTWKAVPFQGNAPGTPAQNFAGLEAAMAHIETHGTM